MAVRAPWRPTARRSPGDLEHEEDRRLAALAADGDEAAFEAIFERHHRGLLTFSRHLLGSQEEAEDTLQHTFAAAYRQLSERGAPEHLRAWLYATTRNRCYSVLRSRRDLPQGDSVPEGTTWLPDEVERRGDLRDLLSDIERLPHDQRVALVLAEIEDLDHAEVAEVLGCSRDKVRALVFQARTTLGGWREARALPCREVRHELATARGGELRRAHLRRHLNVCRDCTAFREDVEQQRRKVALLLPPVPLVFALQEGLLETAMAGAAAAASGAAGGAGAGGAAAGAAAAGGGIATAVKVGAAALVIGGGAAGYGVFSGGGGSSQDPPQQNPTPAAQQPEPTQAAAPPAGNSGQAKKNKKKKKDKTEKRLKASEQNQAAGAAESVEESAAPSSATPAATPAVPTTPAVPATPAAPPAPRPAPPPEAGLEAELPAPPVQVEGEIRATPPVDLPAVP